MRKLLLAATAMIGATAGMANAQVVPPAVVVVPPPSPAATLPDRVPQPGTAVVRLSARVIQRRSAGGTTLGEVSALR
jgi:hypothetical protein